MTNKRWEICSEGNDLAREIATELGLSYITAQVLVNRGITTIEEARSFFQVELTDLLDPFLLLGMEEAVQRLLAGVQENEKMIIFGDYDVDGITGTSVLLRVLRQINKNVDYYIPDRSEGYGLNKDAVHRLGMGGYTLIVTVDNGISCYEEVELANSLGMDVIITDHHEPPEQIPPAVSIINPKLSKCSYPCKYLSGVGVGFKLGQALAQKLNLQTLASYVLEQIDLVALGTVADIVPLLGENRIIVANGLRKIAGTTNPGLRELLKVADLEDKIINTGHLGFTLGPRVNAIGRLGNPMLGVELFTTTEQKRALELAIELDQVNRKRQMIEENIFKQAVEMVEREGYADSYGIVLASEEWHPGVIGIVASKLVEKYYRPTVLIAIKDGIGKGSARGIRGQNLYEALTHCQEYLLGYGGHKMAAGLSISPEQIANFRKVFQSYSQKVLTSEDLVPYQMVDLEVDLAELNFSLLDELEKLEPHGSGNARPVFVVRKVQYEARTVGATGDHLKIQVSKGSHQLGGIGFSMGERLKTLADSVKIDLVFNLNRNIWREREYLQMMLIDLAPVELDFVEQIFIQAANGLQNAEESGDWFLERTKLTSLQDEKLTEHLAEHFAVDTRFHGKLQESLRTSTNTLVHSVNSSDILPTVLSFAGFQALKHRGVTLVLSPLKSYLNTGYGIVQRTAKYLGLNVYKASGLMSISEKRELYSVLTAKPGRDIDIIFTTPEYLKNHLDMFKVLLARIGLLVIPEIHQFGFEAWLGKILSFLKAKIPASLILAYTPLAEQELGEKIREVKKLLSIEQIITMGRTMGDVQISDQRNSTQKDKYLRELILQGEKIVIFVNTPEFSVKLTHTLRKLIPEMSEQVMFYHQKLSFRDGQKIKELLKRGGLTTVVATDYFVEGERIPDIHHVVHYDLALNLTDFRERSQLICSDIRAWIHLLYGDYEGKINRVIMDGRLPDRDLLAKIYIALQKLSDKTGFIPHSPDTLLTELRNKGIRRLESAVLIESLGIFLELSLLEFVRVDDKNGIRLLPKPNQKLDLNSSIRYNECITERREFAAFSELALTEKAEIILQKISRTEIRGGN